MGERGDDICHITPPHWFPLQLPPPLMGGDRRIIKYFKWKNTF